MPFSFQNIRLDGCIFGPGSPKDYRVRFEPRAVPAAVDLRPNCTAVENQGELASCTANAAVGALECLYKARNRTAVDLSRMFVYYNTRRMKGQIGIDCGAQISEAMAAVLAYGACPESTWPYDPRLFAQEPPATAYTAARQYGAIQYARIDDRAGALSALAEGHPVVFGILLPQRCYDEAAVSGKIRPPEQSEVFQRIGGHAMLLVGYDRHDGTFIVRNSWGPSWGDRGYCTIPFAVVEQCCPPNSLWILADPQQRTAFSLVRPAEADAPAPRPTAAAGASSLASRMRDEIRESLVTDMKAASERIANMVRDAATPVRPSTAGDANGVFPLPLSPGSGPHMTRDLGDGKLADDKHHFIGVWRGEFQMQWGLSCKTEIIFQPNDAYSSLTQSTNGAYSFWAQGTWRLVGQGNVQVHYKDWQPKRWGETVLHIPADENIKFTVINKDKMESSLCKWERAKT